MTRESKQLQTPWRNINSQSTYCISTKDMQKEALSQLQLHAEQQMAVRFARVFEQPAYKHTWPGTESPAHSPSEAFPQRVNHPCWTSVGQEGTPSPPPVSGQKNVGTKLTK